MTLESAIELFQKALKDHGNINIFFEFRGKFYDVDSRTNFLNIVDGKEKPRNQNAIILRSF